MKIVKSKLKKRLRKKFHRGEFNEFGFEISVDFQEDVDEIQFDLFLDDFISEIERNNLLFGGGGNDKVWQGFVTSDKKFSSPTGKDKLIIRSFLEKRPEVKQIEIGEFLDAWNDVKWNK